MKRLVFAGLAALALAVATPVAGNAQVRVSVRIDGGHRHGYVHRVYTPRTSYGRYHYNYRDTYRGYGYAAPRVQVVRVYRPAPVVIVRRGYHRVYRHR